MIYLLAQANALRIPLADKSVHCGVTSPPYWKQRKYDGDQQFFWGGDEACEHGWLRNDFCARCGAWYGCLGREPTPEQYVSNLVLVFREVRRVLRDDGILWLNLGDSFAGSMKGIGADGRAYAGPKQATNKGSVGTADKRPSSAKEIGLKPKDLIGIPWRVALALRDDGWYLRCDVIWNKPNCMVFSGKDRPTIAHEYVFLLSKSRNYFYDQDSIREPLAESSLPRAMRGVSDKGKWVDGAPGSTVHTMNRSRPNIKHVHPEYAGGGTSFKDGHSGYYSHDGRLLVNPSGRNKRTVWTIAPKGYHGAHFAVFPPELIEPCIKAGASEKGVCPECGMPWARIKHKVGSYQRRWSEINADGSPYSQQDSYQNIYEQVGWQVGCKCGREDTAPAVVFDPFVGSGTTVMVAERLGRLGIGIDLCHAYLKQAEERVHTDKYGRQEKKKRKNKAESDEVTVEEVLVCQE